MAGVDSSSTATAAISEALGALTSRVAALQGEVRRLNDEVSALGITLAQLEGVPAPDRAEASGPLATPSQWLARRNAERLNTEVMRRSFGGLDPDNDTEVDLMIDRLHTLSDPQQGSE